MTKARVCRLCRGVMTDAGDRWVCNNVRYRTHKGKRIAYYCGFTVKKHTRNVIGDLDGVRQCYGMMPELRTDKCDDCPIESTCAALTAECGGSPLMRPGGPAETGTGPSGHDMERNTRGKGVLPGGRAQNFLIGNASIPKDARVSDISGHAPTKEAVE